MRKSESGFRMDRKCDQNDLVKVTSASLNAGDILTKVSTNAAGASSIFVGTTRDTFEGKRVARLEYEAYVPMAEKELKRLCGKVRERWNVERIAVVHRTGVVPLGEASVVIAVSSAHRKEALEAVHFAIDDLKATVPIWKKEVYTDGTNSWKENKECQWSGIGERNEDDDDDGEEVEVDSALVQITASRAEIDRRIDAFVQRKRAELNNANVLEFCNRHISEEPEFSCARVDSVIVGRKDGKSHFRQSQVVNPDGPQTKSRPTPPKRIKTESSELESPSRTAAADDSEIPVGIRERLVELEKKAPIITPGGPVPKEVYARIKALEDRVRYLEGVSPEYFNNSVKKESIADNGPTAGSAAAVERSEDIAKSLSGINSRIQQLQASLMIKKREIE